MKYGFLTLLIPGEMEKFFFENSKNYMQDAANVLQHNLYEGLLANINENIQIFNILPVGSFPQYFSKAFIRKGDFCCKYGYKHINIGFCNIKLLRIRNKYKNIFRTLNEWCKKDEEEKILFVYTLSVPFLNAIEKIKRKYKNIRICAIVADLPDMMHLSADINLIKKKFFEILDNYAYSKINKIDSFVLLTEQMADYLNIKNKPYCVMEGISTNVSNYGDVKIISDGIKRIFYSGTLHEKFGILNLLEAFKLIDNKNYRLQLCGIGDCEGIIREEAKKDSRIEFFGQLRREEVLKLQKQATILVNPRQNNEEFTKYSFPSKILEYLSSGTPVVAYKLDGMPNDYKDYIFYVDGNEVEKLKNKIVEVCELEECERMSFGQKAQKYVLNEKNAITQTKKIIRMVKGELK